MTLTPPDPHVYADALARSAAQAKPLGALGRLEELGAWLAACQGVCPPEPLLDVRVVVFAGDHGVAAHGVSAYPASVTPLMVREIVAGRAGVNALANSVDVQVRVVDVAVDDDLTGLPPEVSAGKLRRSSAAIHLTDAISREEAERAVAWGAELARREIADGAQLLIAGDLGIGNTTPAAALIGAFTGCAAAAVTGRGTGVDADTLAHKEA
ncbi:MAG: nicotinate-nucleotide--dimethylbenzimidazole phosphoribosyltransferase, partial [Micropruina sp.]